MTLVPPSLSLRHAREAGLFPAPLDCFVKEDDKMAVENNRFTGEEIVVSKEEFERRRNDLRLEQWPDGSWYVAYADDLDLAHGEPTTFATPEDEAYYIRHIKPAEGKR
jgi:hypothetical protein